MGFWMHTRYVESKLHEPHLTSTILLHQAIQAIKALCVMGVTDAEITYVFALLGLVRIIGLVSSFLISDAESVTDRTRAPIHGSGCA